MVIIMDRWKGLILMNQTALCRRTGSFLWVLSLSLTEVEVVSCEVGEREKIKTTVGLLNWMGDWLI